MGRAAMAQALQRFAAEGAWGISPHLIPHRSLHSLSGTVSQALKIHGPNFGVGGGPNGAAEALQAAAALLAGDRLPGVWVVLTGWEPEPVIDRAGRVLNESFCHGAALALVAAREGRPGLRLRVVPGAAAGAAGEPEGSPPDLSAPRLTGLLRALADVGMPPTTVLWDLGGGQRLELEGHRP